MTSVNPTRTSFSSTSCLACLGMGPDGKGKVNLPLISRHKFIHPSWKIGKNFIIKMHHHHAGTGPLGLPKLLHDTLYRPGSYRGDPPRHKAVKGCTGAIGTGKRTPPGGNDLIPQRMPAAGPPRRSRSLSIKQARGLLTTGIPYPSISFNTPPMG